MTSLYIHNPIPSSSRPFSKFQATLDVLKTKLSPSEDSARQELDRLAAVDDGDLFWQGLLQLGRGLQREEKLGEALVVYSEVKSSGNTELVRQKAQAEMDAIEGRGPFGGRAEFLLGRFFKTASDPRAVAPMIAGSAVFQLAKGAALGRMLATSQPAWWMRGSAAKWAASAFGYAIEVPVFTLAGRALQKNASSQMAQELASSAITLGLLKLSGAGSAHVTGHFLRFGSPAARALWTQTSMFGALLASHRAETALGLRPAVGGDTEISDILSSMASMGFGAALGHRLLGPSYSGWLREIQTRMQGSGGLPLMNPEKFSQNFSLATTGKPSLSPLVGDRGHWQAMSQGNRSGDGRPRWAFEEKIKLDFVFADPKKWSESEITKVVKQILLQDNEHFPTGHPAELLANYNFDAKKYQVLGEYLTLSQLAGRVRNARGLNANDRKALPNSEVIRQWKIQLIDELLVKVRGPGTVKHEAPAVDSANSKPVLALDGEFHFKNRHHWSEAEITQVVRAIVNQDELFSEGNPFLVATRDFSGTRKYGLAGEEVSLPQLAERIRLSRGLKADDRVALPDAEIFLGWKVRLFQDLSRGAIDIKGDFHFANPKRWNKAEIGNVLKAIVAQDSEMYPGQDPRLLSAGRDRFMNRWYRVNGEDITLQHLYHRWGGSIADSIRGWKTRVFGLEVLATSRDKIRLTGEFSLNFEQHFFFRPTENEVMTIVKAIVAQDPWRYPEKDSAPMSAIPRYFNREYILPGYGKITLRSLVRYYRRAKGLEPADNNALPDSQVVLEWQTKLSALEGGEER